MEFNDYSQDTAPVKKFQRLRSVVSKWALPAYVATGTLEMFNPRLAGNDLVNHAPSMLMSWNIGVVASWGFSKLASRFSERGHDRLAHAAERAGTTLSWLGSAAYQLAAETGHIPFLNTRDVWDMSLGLAVTSLATRQGRQFAKSCKVDRQERESNALQVRWDELVADLTMTKSDQPVDMLPGTTSEFLPGKAIQGDTRLQKPRTADLVVDNIYRIDMQKLFPPA